MERRKLPLSALRAFESAAEQLNLSRAGEQLGVTHGAISHQIRALEGQLKAQLFSRANNRLSLTPAGRRLYEAVSTGFNIILDGTRNLKPQDLSGPLVIACTQTTASVWATKPICHFSEKYPSIEISVRDIEPLQKNIPQDVDIAICYGKPEDANERDISYFATPMLYPVCNPRLLSARNAPKKADDLIQFPILHDGAVPWSRWFEQYGDPNLEPTNNLHFANTSQALNAMRLGYGVALANTFEIKQYIQDGECIHLFEDKPLKEQNSYYLVKHKTEFNPLKVTIFEELIRQMVL